MISVPEAKVLMLEKFGYSVIEEEDLGKMPEGDLIKGEAHPPKGIIVRADLDDTMKLIGIAHEAGHLLEHQRVGTNYLRGTILRVETKAWLNGLPLAIEMGILNEYTNYWRVHLDKS